MSSSSVPTDKLRKELAGGSSSRLQRHSTTSTVKELPIEMSSLIIFSSRKEPT